jgi:hypothetical protein
MDLSGTVGDASEIMANVGGERGHPGSYALKALPHVQEGHVWTSCTFGVAAVWSVVATVAWDKYVRRS